MEDSTEPHRWYTLEQLFGEVGLRSSVRQFDLANQEADEDFRRAYNQPRTETNPTSRLDALLSIAAGSAAGMPSNPKGEARAVIHTPLYTTQLDFTPTSADTSDKKYYPFGETDAVMGIDFRVSSLAPVDLLQETTLDTVVFQKYGYALLLRPPDGNQDVYASLSFAERFPTQRELQKTHSFNALAQLVGLEEERLLNGFPDNEESLSWKASYGKFRRFSLGQADLLYEFFLSSYQDLHPDSGNIFARSGLQIFVPRTYDSIKGVRIMLVDVEKPAAELAQLLLRTS